MYLKRLEIHGFKSFASKAVLEFSRGIIAIVGPNGSGKSNVADAIRWVLGEQSPKIIRGKSSQDVIFAGSDKKTRLGFAEVVATFDNADRHIPVDSAEVSIGRRVDRSGESEYLLNGNRVRLLDIIDLVLRSNIGTSRYTVIGQGTIDQMVMAGPTEVKNLIDEASGVKNYYLKRERTLRRLEQTANNLMRAEDLMREIEPRLKSLRRQAKKMEARAELEQELKALQQKMFSYNYGLLSSGIAELESRLGQVQERRGRLEDELTGQRHELERQESSGSEQGGFRQIQDSLKQLQDGKNRLLEELSVVRGKMQSQKTAAGDPKTLQVELHQKSRTILESQEQLAATRTQQQRLEGTVAELRRRLEEFTAKLSALYGKSKNPAQIDWSLFDLELSSLDESFGSFWGVLESSPDIATAKSAAERLRDSFQKFRTVAKNIVKDPQAVLEEFQRELQQAMAQKDALGEELRRQELDLSRAKMSADFFASQISGLEQEKLHLELELKKAESSSLDDFLKNLIADEERIKDQLQRAKNSILEVEAVLKEHYRQEELRRLSMRQAEEGFRSKQDELSLVKDEESRLGIEKAKLDTQMEVLLEESRRILGSETTAGLATAPRERAEPEVEERILRLKNQLDMIGGMDELTVKEYQETESRYASLHEQVGDLKKGMDDLRAILDELDEHIKSRFNESFHRINEKFEFYFRLLFNGGRAHLNVLRPEPQQEIVDGESEEAAEPENQQAVMQIRPEEKILQKYAQPASSITGIDIKATPPGKKLAAIQALSGGERALTSIALLCSLLACFPSPFVVLDEVDAALDEANTIRFGQILGTLSHQTQFITITHNRETMAQSTMLYGVTMGDDGVSKLLSIKFDQAAQYAK